MEAEKSLKKGERATAVSATVSAFLSIIKFIAGTLSGSVALVTSSLDSLADVVGMIASWFGFRIAGRKADGKFPYGYYKAESMSMLFVSFLILYAAFSLLLRGYERLFLPPDIGLPFIGLGISFLSIFISFGLSRFLLREGKSINSDLLITNSKERLGDVAATVAVFIAVAMSYLKIPYVEGIVTIIISLLIMRIGIFSVKDSVATLMDTSPSPEKEDIVRRILESEKEVEGFDGLRLRKSGPFLFGDVTIKVREDANVVRAHSIADDIEKKIKHILKETVLFTVHVEPFKKSVKKIAIPVRASGGLRSPVEGGFARASYIIFVTTKGGRVKSFYAKRNPVRKKSLGSRLAAAHVIIGEKADAIAVGKIGEIAFHTLRDHLVEVYEQDGRTAGEVARKFAAGRLKRLMEHAPTRKMKE